MNAATIAANRRYMAEESKRWPAHLVDVPRSVWGNQIGVAHRIRVLRSNRFMVQVFELNGQTRLTIQRTALANDGGWRDGITWDEIQTLKRESGYGERCAVEIYPPDTDIVNVANMRHIWLIDPPAFMWHKGMKP